MTTALNKQTCMKICNDKHFGRKLSWFHPNFSQNALFRHFFHKQLVNVYLSQLFWNWKTWEVMVTKIRGKFGLVLSTKRWMVKLIDLVNVLQESSSGSDCETAKGKLFPDNPFICRTPSATMVDMHGTVDYIAMDRKAVVQMCWRLRYPNFYAHCG